MNSSLRSSFSWYVSCLWAFEAVFTGLYRGVNRLACISLDACSCMGKSNLIPGISAFPVLFLARQLLLGTSFIFKQDKEQTLWTACDQKQNFYCKHWLLWALSNTWFLLKSVVGAKDSGQERKESEIRGLIGNLIITFFFWSQILPEVIGFWVWRPHEGQNTSTLGDQLSEPRTLHLQYLFSIFQCSAGCQSNADFMEHEENHWRERGKSHWGHWSHSWCEGRFWGCQVKFSSCGERFNLFGLESSPTHLMLTEWTYLKTST